MTKERPKPGLLYVDGCKVMVNPEKDILIDGASRKYLHYVREGKDGRRSAIIYVLKESYDGSYYYRELRDSAALETALRSYFGEQWYNDPRITGHGSLSFQNAIKSLRRAHAHSE
jgi:hypothetical protein